MEEVGRGRRGARRAGDASRGIQYVKGGQEGGVSRGEKEKETETGAGNLDKKQLAPYRQAQEPQPLRLLQWQHDEGFDEKNHYQPTISKRVCFYYIS